MKTIDKNKIYGLSPDIITREIEDTLVIVPLISDIGKLDEDLFSLNNTGKTIWQMLDGEKNVQNLIQEIAQKYGKNATTIEDDVIDLLKQLLDKGLIVEIQDTI